MYQVTARVFNNNQLVGYQITDGSQTQLFTKQQAWMYAKNKQLLNVIATGDESNPGLSGTNGFELKRLPEIKWKDPQSVKTKFDFNAQDVASALIRNALKTRNILERSDRDGAMQLLKADVANGVVSQQNCRTLSSSLLVEKYLYDRILAFGPNIIGYQIKNSGNQPIPITRMTATPDHSTSEVILNCNESIWLNKAEMALLASKPEIGCTFANGKLIRGTSRPKTTLTGESTVYKFLINHYFTLDGKAINTVDGMGVNIKQIESPDIIDTYFLPYNYQDQVAALIRNAVKTGKVPATNKGSRAYRSELIKEDVSAGVLSKDNFRALSHSIYIENTLRDGTKTGGLQPAVIGYKIKNVGKQPLKITRITATPDHTQSQATLSSGQSICLNRAEMALLGSRPEINCTFVNGVVNNGSNLANSVYDFLNGHYFTFGFEDHNSPEDNKSVYDTDVMLDIRKLESQNNISTYFIPGDTSQKVQKMQKDGLFNAFKR